MLINQRWAHKIPGILFNQLRLKTALNQSNQFQWKMSNEKCRHFRAKIGIEFKVTRSTIKTVIKSLVFFLNIQEGKKWNYNEGKERKINKGNYGINDDLT